MEEPLQESSEKFSNYPGYLKILVLALLSALAGALIALALLPYLFGSTPFDFYSKLNEERLGSFDSSPSKTIIESKGTSGYAVAVAKKVQPWVVNIATKEIGEHFFKSSEEIEGVGSGVIYRKDGYILTNNHVVEGASQITVTLPDNKEVKGKVIGKDRDTDLAVIKIKANNLPVAELGSSAKLQVGEAVLAIGSPFGLEHTVTGGIISALHRNVTTHVSNSGGSTTLIDLIQTDAAINPGNSGGALVNTKGELIGINALIFSETGGSKGIGFAIPIDLAKRSAEQIIKRGWVSHPFMGIVGTDFSREETKKNLPYTKGAIITEVSPNTPAAEAGLREKDVIVKFDGNNIENMEDLIAKIRQKKVGDKVTITFFRGSKKYQVSLELIKKPRKFM